MFAHNRMSNMVYKDLIISTIVDYKMFQKGLKTSIRT